MSVQYKLNKDVRIRDLKKIGLIMEDHREDADCHPFVVLNEKGDGVAISEVTTNEDPNEDNWEVNEFEGRCHCGGAAVMLEICDKLDCKFITDEDIDNLIYEGKEEITEEMFNERTEAYRKLVNGER